MSASQPGRINVFITPSVLREFRRINDRDNLLSDEDIIAIIQTGLANPASVSKGRREDGTPVVWVRVRNVTYRDRRYAFRATVRPAPASEPGGWPVVQAIFPAGSHGPNRPATTASGLVEDLRGLSAPGQAALIRAAGARPGHRVAHIFPDGSGLSANKDGSWSALPPKEAAKREALPPRREEARQ